MLQSEIIEDLELRSAEILNWAESLRKTNPARLNNKPSETGWSALECIDHLNRYSDFYLPVLSKAIEKAHRKTSDNYRPGWLGNKMAMDMLPQNGQLKSTMKTFKSKNPVIDGVDPAGLEKFILFQKDIIALLEKAKAKNLSSVRVSTTIPILRLKLGDTLRFFIFHQVRHVEQAKKAIGK